MGNLPLRKEGKVEECLMPSPLLRTSAIKLLFANRYLDFDDEFYKELHELYSFLIVMDKALTDWKGHGEEIET